MREKLTDYWHSNYRYILSVVIVFAIAISLPSFSLFEDRHAGMLQSHLLLELFALIVAILIAVISWHDQQFDRGMAQSGILLAGFTVVAAMDVSHALSYQGMPKLLVENTTHRAIVFWLAGRTMVAFTLYLMLFMQRTTWSRTAWLGIGTGISVMMFWIGTYHLDLIPNTFVPGIGVTTFKRNYEYALFTADILLCLLFIMRASSANRTQYHAFATSCLVMALGELVFSNYTAPSDFLNIFGHVFKIISYAFLYRSIFITAIRLPYKQVRDSEERFRSLTELSTDWYWEQDENFRFTMISQSVGRLQTGDFIGNARWELPLEGVSAEQWAEHRKLLDAHKPYTNFNYKVRGNQGELRSVLVSGFPFFNEQGKFQGYRGTGTDVTEREASEQRIEQLAYHDTLTGLPNRLLIQDRFEQAIAYASRTQKRTALLFLDLDHFKNTNDALGHHIGDMLLKEVTARLQGCIRETDTLSRQGGDEFLLVVPDLAQSDDIIPMLSKIMELFRQPFSISGHEILTTVSIGIAMFPDDGEDFDSLRQKADMAMYQAKAAGRNTYRYYDISMNKDVVEHLFIQNGLRLALERNEFLLHYQPQIDLASNRIIGVEALLRWQHPEQGMIPPGRFIHVAEESGLIVPIGERILHEACRQAMKWQQAGLPPIYMAVNLSAIQFRREGIVGTVRNSLALTGLKPEWLELELTESIMLHNAEHTLSTLNDLKQLGVKLSIDDFGTGYSSLAYLKRFDIDKLKIDQTFVRDLATDPEDEAIVRAIIQMAKSLNLKTIAEGVETEDMLNRLIQFECDEVQGYLFARPMPAEAAEAFMRNWQTANK